MRHIFAVSLVAVLVLLTGRAVDLEYATRDASAHLIRVSAKPARSLLENRAARQRTNLRHAAYVCRQGGGQHRRWACWASSSRIRANGQGWLRREHRETMNLLRPATHTGARETICQVFGAYCSQALHVAICESDYYPRDGVPDTVARNGQYLGMFQMGTSERATYGHGSTPLEQAQAAYTYFVASGRDWSPWDRKCRP